MDQRPEIGARVRILPRTGLKDTTGRPGRVIAHYPNDEAFRVRLDDGREIVCDPVNVAAETVHA